MDIREGEEVMAKDVMGYWADLEWLAGMSDKDRKILQRRDSFCEERIKLVAELSDANESQIETIERLSRLTRGGHRFADLVVRKDGVEHRFEADWVIQLLTRRPR